MNNSTPFFYVLFLISLGCSQKVVHYVNPASSFETYDSYELVNYKVNEDNLSAEGIQLFNQIATFINLQMARRGYEKDNSSPDLIVRYELISNQVTQVNVNNTGFGFYSPYPRRYFTTRTFLESGLFVEITESSTNKLVWQASIDLNRYSKKEDTDKILRKATEQLFNTFLYSSGSENPDESFIVK